MRRRQFESASKNLIDFAGQELGTGAKVGADPFLFTESSWNYYQDGLSAKNIELIAINENLVDLVWDKMDRPENSKEEIFVHDVKYAGQGSADTAQIGQYRQERVC